MYPQLECPENIEEAINIYEKNPVQIKNNYKAYFVEDDIKYFEHQFLTNVFGEDMFDTNEHEAYGNLSDEEFMLFWKKLRWEEKGGKLIYQKLNYKENEKLEKNKLFWDFNKLILKVKIFSFI